MVTTEPDRTGENGPEWERVLWRLDVPCGSVYLQQMYFRIGTGRMATTAVCMHHLSTPLRHLHFSGRLYSKILDRALDSRL